MSTLGPLSSTELASIKLHAELDSASDPRAVVLLRLIKMIEARSAIAAELHATIEALRAVCLNWGSDAEELDEWVRQTVAKKMRSAGP